MTLNTCQQGCIELKQTFSIATKIKTFAENSKQRQEFDKADTNKDNYIDFEEFMATMKNEDADMHYRDVYAQGFRMADTNQDGKLSFEELEEVYRKHESSLMQNPKVTWDCTYRCGIWNTCMMKGAWNGDTTKCGSMPSGCKCIW